MQPLMSSCSDKRYNCFTMLTNSLIQAVFVLLLLIKYYRYKSICYQLILNQRESVCFNFIYKHYQKWVLITLKTHIRVQPSRSLPCNAYTNCSFLVLVQLSVVYAVSTN